MQTCSLLQQILTTVFFLFHHAKCQKALLQSLAFAGGNLFKRVGSGAVSGQIEFFLVKPPEIEAVRDAEKRDVELRQFLVQFALLIRIDGSCRFVKDCELRLVEEQTRPPDPLLFASGEHISPIMVGDVQGTRSRESAILLVGAGLLQMLS
mmetsp:Transcript_802/g.1001  ORF Transcript_802/g.1001 Transcript_802/m.1001 type:complete len:151 (-) Transcript_802:164-616(-)